MQPTWSNRDSGAGVGHVGYPCSQVVDLMSTGVHKAGKSAPPSSGTPSLSMEGQQALFSFGPSGKEIPSCPHHNISGNEGRVENAGGIFPQAPLRPLLASQGPPYSQWCYREDHPPLLHSSTWISCQILQASQLEGLWQNGHLWVVQKAYL